MRFDRFIFIFLCSLLSCKTLKKIFFSFHTCTLVIYEYDNFFSAFDDDAFVHFIFHIVLHFTALECVFYAIPLQMHIHTPNGRTKCFCFAVDILAFDCSFDAVQLNSAYTHCLSQRIRRSFIVHSYQ